MQLERAAREVLQVFVETQKEGVFMPADWLYNEAIKRRGFKNVAHELLPGLYITFSRLYR